MGILKAESVRSENLTTEYQQSHSVCNGNGLMVFDISHSFLLSKYPSLPWPNFEILSKHFSHSGSSSIYWVQSFSLIPQLLVTSQTRTIPRWQWASARFPRWRCPRRPASPRCCCYVGGGGGKEGRREGAKDDGLSLAFGANSGCDPPRLVSVVQCSASRGKVCLSCA